MSTVFVDIRLLSLFSTTFSFRSVSCLRHALDKMEEPKDSEDTYPEYVSKVKKIYNHQQGGPMPLCRSSGNTEKGVRYP